IPVRIVAGIQTVNKYVPVAAAEVTILNRVLRPVTNDEIVLEREIPGLEVIIGTRLPIRDGQAACYSDDHHLGSVVVIKRVAGQRSMFGVAQNESGIPTYDRLAGTEAAIGHGEGTFAPFI